MRVQIIPSDYLIGNSVTSLLRRSLNPDRRGLIILRDNTGIEDEGVMSGAR
jgi:hypothetical protein